MGRIASSPSPTRLRSICSLIYIFITNIIKINIKFEYSAICLTSKLICNFFFLQKIIKALGQSWHEYHFTCGGPCAKPMSGQSFFERDGKPYCKEDFEQIFAAKCAGCARPISDKAIIALDAKWHKDCFKCKV